MVGETEDAKINEKPKPRAGDAVHTAVRAGLSLIPVVGGAAKEIFSAIVTPPLIKRQTEWIESVVNRLRELEQHTKEFSIENLSHNESFLSAVTYATIIAIRNHREEKLEALRNAVINTAVSPLVEEDLQHMFLYIIDELTPWHLRVLEFFNAPEDWLRRNGIAVPNYSAGGSSTVFYDAFPELKKNKEFAKQLVRDLSARGLAFDWNSMNVMTTREGMFSPRTTPMGKQFLRFITSPMQK